MTRAPATILAELEAVRAGQTRLDLIFRRDGELTDAQDREFQTLDERETALVAEMRAAIEIKTGLFWAQLERAVA